MMKMQKVLKYTNIWIIIKCQPIVQKDDLHKL